MAPRTPSTSARRQQTTADGLARVNETLDAAQEALKALRKDLGAGGRSLLKDVEALLKSARRDTGKLSRAVQADLEALGRAVTSPGKSSAPPRKRTASAAKPAARKRPAASAKPPTRRKVSAS
jgi:ABC-type transporter Mla subunit MlaD